MWLSDALTWRLGLPTRLDGRNEQLRVTLSDRGGEAGVQAGLFPTKGHADPFPVTHPVPLPILYWYLVLVGLSPKNLNSSTSSDHTVSQASAMTSLSFAESNNISKATERHDAPTE